MDIVIRKANAVQSYVTLLTEKANLWAIMHMDMNTWKQDGFWIDNDIVTELVVIFKKAGLEVDD